jgi:TatD DNase family protein
MSSLADQFPRTVVPCYGIHPWFAHKAGRRRRRRRHSEATSTIASSSNDNGNDRFVVDDSDWLAELEQLLLANPLSCVGEIGLDKVWVPPESNQDEGGDGAVAWDDQVL